MMVKDNLGYVQNQFKVVLAKKEIKDGRRYTYADIQAVTGVATSTLTDWAKGKTNNASFLTLAALCYFFECSPADLLEYIPPEKVE